MKLKCVKAHEDPSSGFLGLGAHGRKPIEGLTEGKEYDGETINVLSGGGSISVNNDFQFLIYNDLQEWESYDLNLFQPV